jgi:hypothetical protein
VPLTIAPGAAATSYSITVTTGSEVYTVNPGFTVVDGGGMQISGTTPTRLR